MGLLDKVMVISMLKPRTVEKRPGTLSEVKEELCPVLIRLAWGARAGAGAEIEGDFGFAAETLLDAWTMRPQMGLFQLDTILYWY